MNKIELEERLINFAVSIIDITNSIPKTYAGVHLSKQLIRSGTSPALNYAEAQSGESRKDFIHKIKIVLKELRETLVNLKIIKKAKIYEDLKIELVLNESNELISIFVKSVETAQRNLNLK